MIAYACKTRLLNSSKDSFQQVVNRTNSHQVNLKRGKANHKFCPTESAADTMTVESACSSWEESYVTYIMRLGEFSIKTNFTFNDYLGM